MNEMLEKARRMARSDPHLSLFDIHIEGEELHLGKDGECFARLIRTETPGMWRMAYFHNLERWEYLDFTGTLEDCLAFLSDNPHYLFWQC
jgi:hypothetical protein